MNRRDTIVISVLVNMALLVVLFVTAIKPSSPVEIAKVSLIQEKKEVKLPVVEERPSLDQIDNLLGNFVAKEVAVDPPVAVETRVEEKKELVPRTKEIIIKQGDNLEKLAKLYHTTVPELMKLNHITESRLHIGQILYVPEVEMVQKEAPVSAPSSKTSEAKYYIVKHGDNPWTIAIKNGIKVEELLKLNNLDENKAKKLKPGDKLRIS